MNHKQLLLKIQGYGDSLKVTVASTLKAWKGTIMATNHLAATLLHSQIKDKSLYGATQKARRRRPSMHSFPEAHSQGMEPVFSSTWSGEATQPHLDLHIGLSLNSLPSQML